jgi:two-component system, cell cycle sensor histidine kinase and response regulator CckA
MTIDAEPQYGLGGADRLPATPAILIADDEEEVREIVREILEEHGYAVFEAANGKEVVGMVERGPIDLIILDLIMPEQEGIETLHLLRYWWPKVKVLAISGAFGGSFLRCAKNMGADAVLKKPFSCEALTEMVDNLLRE